jgi:Ion channel
MSPKTGRTVITVVIAILIVACLFVLANYYAVFHLSPPVPKLTPDDLWWLVFKLSWFIAFLIGIIRPFYMIPPLPNPYGAFVTFCFIAVELMGIATVIMMYAEIYILFGLKNSAGADVNDGVSCLYFSIITWTTVGYGDLLPSDPIRLVAASEALVGYVAMAFLIAFLTQRLTSWSGRFRLRDDFPPRIPQTSTPQAS